MVSDASGPHFHKADSDFENVYFEEDTSSIFPENSPTNEKKNLQQEAATFCSGDIINRPETVEEELPAVQGEVIVNTGKSQEGCDTSSWEGSVQGGGDEEDEGEEMNAGKQLLLAYKGDKHHGNSQADRARPSVERRLLPPEGGENTPVGNQERGEIDSDEISYFQSVPEHSSKTERTEDDQQEIDKAAKSKEEEEEKEEQDEDDSDDEHKDEREEEEDKVLSLCFKQEVKNAHWDDQAEDILDFLELKVQNLQDLMADEEEPAQKMEDFSGEDHQEAGESFAECPSDSSSCEYKEHGGGDDESSGLWTGGQGTVERETDVGNRDTEEWKDELVETMSGDITATSCETSDSYSSGDEEDRVTSEDVLNQLDEHHGGSRDDLLVDDERLPDGTLCPAEGVGMSSGSLDDGFFDSAERQRPQISGLEEVGDDENEERSNWEQEQERIRAFNEFYEDSGHEGTGKGEGQGEICVVQVTASVSFNRETDKGSVQHRAVFSGHSL